MKRFVFFAIASVFIFSIRISFGSGLYASSGVCVFSGYAFHAQDTAVLRYPMRSLNDPTTAGNTSPLFLKTPLNAGYIVEFNAATGQYVFYQKVGNNKGLTVKVMSQEEYQNFQQQNSLRNYWEQKRQAEAGTSSSSSFLPDLQLGGETFDRIFGSNKIDIKPQGNAELILGLNTSRTDNPSLPLQLRKTTTFDFQSKIQMNVAGKIGDKLKMQVNYNTEATFDFENNVKLEYTGYEDEIIQKIEAGNVSLPLSGSLITGSQSLFGFKTELKFGNLTVTSIVSQQKSQSQSINVKGGAQTSDFEVRSDNYDVNRHFFLGQFFRDIYDKSLSTLPVISSGVTVNKIEVWVTNKAGNYDNARDILGLMDLGEGTTNISNSYFSQSPGKGPNPSNDINTAFSLMDTSNHDIRSISKINAFLNPLGLQSGRDYEKVEKARKLTPSEYTINPSLGFISLNTSLNADEVLAVAYEYSYRGKTYKVGELTSEGITSTKALIVKLLKGTNLSPRLNTWKLMMKNIYSIGAYQVSKDNFILDILYEDAATGKAVNYIKEGGIANQPLLKVMRLDNVNSQLDPYPDGVFDFIEGVTILSGNGRIIFPVLEPFGRNLRPKLGTFADKYVYEELYDSTQTKARQVPEKNKFLLSGSYQSSGGSDIPLNAMNVPQGSVVVTAGGMKLVENVDYSVDYVLGRVKIINTGLLESGTPIKISLENNSAFNFQTKTLVGSHFNYEFSDNFNLGATVLNLTERPLTQKVNYGAEPISNTIWGLNGSYKTDSRFLTKMVDKLPFIQTKEPSSILFEGEFAKLSPGHSKAIGSSGTAYIDDFEGSESSIDLRQWSAWVLSSTPQLQPGANGFPEGDLTNDLRYGYNRAKLAWFTIDPLFNRTTSYTPSHIKKDKEQLSNHFVREVNEQEIFNKDQVDGLPSNIPTLNLSFYPQERGPYNFDWIGVDGTTGKLLNPKNRWGGIMRSLPITDFEASNIDYISFWMMDPFVYNQSSTGGDLLFNLGNISEDILRDGRKSFEQGLPTSADLTRVDTTRWGRIPLVQSLVKSFDNDEEKRRLQDVGLDGLSSTNEYNFFQSYVTEMQTKFGAGSPIAQQASADPASDDYHFYRGADYDKDEVSILDRYKKYNNPEGNSAGSTSDGYTTSATSMPDVEDINSDNTLSDAESYYQYRVHLTPAGLQIGRNFVTDIREANVDLANGSKGKVKWYQFKVPISEYEQNFGSIQDFKSIRFMRMMLKGFQDTVILRFARLELVRGEWRKYNRSLQEGQEGLGSTDAEDPAFDISTVNVEENSSRQPVNYILPPGISRVIDPSNPQVRQLNEQALMLTLKDLQDGDGRGIFKTAGYDVRQYKNIMMDVHAEALEGYGLSGGDMSIFIRFGSDQKNNYYEYEIPLSVTPAGYYANNDAGRQAVWPESNKLSFELERFPDAKTLRNDAMHKPGSMVTLSTVYEVPDGARKIKVVGNPSLSQVKVILIGVRNPSKNRSSSDDGQAKSGIVWVNELRLTSFDESGGWAANARTSIKLADLGNVSVAGSIIKAGFGSIESNVNERSKENIYQYDVASNFELGRFFPDKLGLKIPMFIGYSEIFKNPEYNPLDQDIRLQDALDNADSKHERDSIKRYSQDYTRRKSINFTNVKFVKTKGQPRFYDIANWATTYSYSELFARNVDLDHRIQKEYRGVLGYNFNTRPITISPFQKMKLFRPKSMNLIRDFNFNLVPSQVAFRTDINRSYREEQRRNLNNKNQIIMPTYSKDFAWTRFYSLSYEPTRSIKIDFAATNLARIDEPVGMVDKDRDPLGYENWRDSVWANARNFGRNVNYNHNFNVTYNIPINKFPLLDFTNANARYSGTYEWDAGPIMPDTSSLDPGNTIKNSQTLQFTGGFNMVTLYNKIGLLKRINNEFDQMGRPNPNKKKEFKEVTYEATLSATAKKARSVYHKLGTQDVKVKVTSADGKEIKIIIDADTPDRVRVTSDEDISNAKIVVIGKVEKRNSPLVFAGKLSLRLLMSVKNISFTYSQVGGMILPGYKPGTKMMGLTDYSRVTAPGWPFVLGNQDQAFPLEAAKNGWLSKDTTLNNPFAINRTENINLRITIEPIPDFRIDITGLRTFSQNRSEYWTANSSGAFSGSDPLISGNYSVSVMCISTAFEESTSSNNYRSDAFEQFKKNRFEISKRLAEKRVINTIQGYDPSAIDATTGYFAGYGPLSQEVLIPAFLAAYTNTSSSSVSLDNFPKIPLPNWQVTYNGLAKLAPFKTYFKSVTLSHGYKSVYSIGSYTTNSSFMENGDGFSYIRNAQNDFVAKRDILNVSISEQFSPLISVDLGWQNNLTTKGEVRRSRNLAMSFSSNQLTEQTSWEYIFGVGYRFDNVPLIFGNPATGAQKVNKTNLRITTDVSIRNVKNFLRRLAEDIDEISGGQKITTIKVNADYTVSEKVTLRAYFDRTVNAPYVSNVFPIATSNFGFSLRVEL
ncbi:T9SS outer membrane translocon Sov/SprA [Williamwhitmania taraxaci]|uniref:Cell surface protein SprA n=1 Tax=Williamwhitmania taraxaci TaxID=1640674 RepID=A0A1G6R2H0_9BACT|nr:cell surface protein SprA [Williamwhitmania taraxaci]SDC98217.1 cell surface protein SprA [Williamwhitmania taraxaci]